MPIADRDTYGHVAVEDSFYDRVREFCGTTEFKVVCSYVVAAGSPSGS